MVWLLLTTIPTKTMASCFPHTPSGKHLHFMGKRPQALGNRTSASSLRSLLETAVRQHQSDQLDAARATYRKVLKQSPDHPDAIHFLSRLYYQTGKTDDALKLVRRGLKIYQGNPHLHCMLGNIYRSKGNFPSAIDAFKKTIALDNQSTEARINLGMSLKDAGRFAEAIETYQQAIAIDPSIAETHNNLGNVYKANNQIDLAITAYRKAVEINPGFAGGFHNLGSALLETGDKDEALATLRHASKLAPDNALFLQALASCFSQLKVNEYDESLRDDLQRCLQLDRIDGRGLGKTISHFLKLTELNQNDPLLISYMQREQICDLELEDWLAIQRRSLLENIIQNDRSAINTGFLVALANQCFLNEYIYDESKEETEQIAHLVSEESNDETIVSIIACYRPLSSLSFSDKLSVPETIIQQQITEPETEAKLKKQIRTLSDSGSETSSEVRAQYEENPYPRWQLTDRPEATTLGNYLRTLFPDHSIRTNFPAKLAILSAGGGTGLQPIRTATRFPKSQVNVLDLSLNSLAYGMRKAKELGIKNIKFEQADLLNLDSYKKQFDFIESYGVLHHLAVPFEGWQALYNLLKPGGVMRIGLYSQIARQPINAARELIAEKQLPPTPEGIRQFRRLLKSLDESHPARSIIESPDFYTLSECRDLVFHVCEHQYTLPEIKETLDKLELEFIGFEFPEFRTLREFKSTFPDQYSEKNLDHWNEFEQNNPDSFASQYVFWVIKPT